MRRIGIALWAAAAIGAALSFFGMFTDARNITIAGVAILAGPVLVIVGRLLRKPPDVVDTLDAEIGVSFVKNERVELPDNQAKSALRDTGAERRPN